MIPLAYVHHSASTGLLDWLAHALVWLGIGRLLRSAPVSVAVVLVLVGLVVLVVRRRRRSA